MFVCCFTLIELKNLSCESSQSINMYSTQKAGIVTNLKIAPVLLSISHANKFLGDWHKSSDKKCINVKVKVEVRKREAVFNDAEASGADDG